MAHAGHLDRFPYSTDDFSCLAAHCPSTTLSPSQGVCVLEAQREVCLVVCAHGTKNAHKIGHHQLLQCFLFCYERLNALMLFTAGPRF